MKEFEELEFEPVVFAVGIHIVCRRLEACVRQND